MISRRHLQTRVFEIANGLFRVDSVLAAFRHFVNV